MSASHAKTLQSGDMGVSLYGSWSSCRSEAPDHTPQDAGAILEPQAPESTLRTEKTPDASPSFISAWSSADLEQAGSQCLLELQVLLLWLSTISTSSPHLWGAVPLSLSLRTETVCAEGDLCLCLQLFCLKIHIFYSLLLFLKIFIYFGLFFLMYFFLLKYSWLTMFLVHSEVIHVLYIYTYIIFEIIFHYRLLQDIDYRSLCYTLNLCCLLHICFFKLEI